MAHLSIEPSGEFGAVHGRLSDIGGEPPYDELLVCDQSGGRERHVTAAVLIPTKLGREIVWDSAVFNSTGLLALLHRISGAALKGVRSRWCPLFMLGVEIGFLRGDVGVPLRFGSKVEALIPRRTAIIDEWLTGLDA